MSDRAPDLSAARSRRRLLVLGIGGAAAAAGATLAWRREVAKPPPGVDVWGLRFPRPGGGEVVLATLRGRPVLLNFWATWCPPCVTEMPLLDAFHARHGAQGWTVVGLAVDQEKPVLRFLAERSISFPIGLAGAAGLELARDLGNAAGGLPFSVAFGADGKVLQTKLGALDEPTLSAWAGSVPAVVQTDAKRL